MSVPVNNFRQISSIFTEHRKVLMLDNCHQFSKDISQNVHLKHEPAYFTESYLQQSASVAFSGESIKQASTPLSRYAAEFSVFNCKP